MKYQYRGFGTRTYPGRSLQVREGESVEFGDGSPPDDGFWYPCDSEEQQQAAPGTEDAPQEESK